MKPRKRIKSVSTARAKQRAEYVKLKKIFLSERNRCFVCGLLITWHSRALHHYAGRQGRLLCWEPGFRMACNNCHAQIHARPRWARDNGYIAPKGCWNDYQRAVKHIENMEMIEGL